MELVARFCEGAHFFLNLSPWISESMTEVFGGLGNTVSIGLHEGHTFVVPLDYSKHTSELAFDVVQAAGVSRTLDCFLGTPHFGSEHDRQAQVIRAEVGQEYRVSAIHVDTGADKMLPDSVWREVIWRFLDSHPGFIVLLLGERVLRMGAGRHADRVIPCYGLKLGASMCLVGQADLFAGIDSCLLHAADFFRVPGVGVFVSTDPHEFGFLIGPHRYVVEREPNGAGIADRVLLALGNLEQEAAFPDCRLRLSEPELESTE